MAYDPPNYQQVLWDASGKPYWNTAGGKKTYIPPIVAAQYQDDPKLQGWAQSQGAKIDYTTPGQASLVSSGAPQGSFFKNRGTWNSETGQYDQGVNWGNVLALGVGGAIAAPVVAGALGGIGGGAAASSAGTAASSGAAATGGGAAAAAGGGGVAGSIGSWLTSPTAALIGTGLQVAGNVWSTNKQVDANAEAARIQAAEYDKALVQAQKELDYQHGLDSYKQGQYANYLGRLDPYAKTGQAANNRLSQFMGQPAAAQTPLGPQAGTQTYADVGPRMQSAAPQTVMLMAPDGTQKAVPAAQAQHFIQLGAKPVPELRQPIMTEGARA